MKAIAEKTIMTELLADLERAYGESANKNSMEYTYGYMDAMAVVRRRIEKPAGMDPWMMLAAIMTCAAFGGASREKKETCERCSN